MADQARTDYSDPPLEQINIVEIVCKRPDCYTRHGTIDEVAAFLEGYRIGLRHGAADRRKVVEECRQLDRFFESLKKRLGAESVHWSILLWEQTEDNESGLKLLEDMAREFRKSNGVESSSPADSRN